MEMHLRHMQPKDAPQVAVLIRRLTPNIREPEKLEWRLRELACPWHSEYGGSVSIVAVTDDVVAGHAQLVWTTIPSKGKIGEIQEVVVHEDYEGNGVGGRLLAALIETAVTIRVNRLRLTTSNPRAEKLYEKKGFKVKEGEKYMILDL